jgi:hypothetical protein
MITFPADDNIPNNPNPPPIQGEGSISTYAHSIRVSVASFCSRQHLGTPWAQPRRRGMHLPGGTVAPHGATTLSTLFFHDLIHARLVHYALCFTHTEHLLRKCPWLLALSLVSDDLSLSWEAYGKLTGIAPISPGIPRQGLGRPPGPPPGYDRNEPLGQVGPTHVLPYTPPRRQPPAANVSFSGPI